MQSNRVSAGMIAALALTLAPYLPPDKEPRQPYNQAPLPPK